MEVHKRDFKGIWIPRELYLNQELNWTEKILLIEINSLDHGDGCFASNEYLGKFVNKSTNSIINILTNLRKKGYIKNVKFNGRKRWISATEKCGFPIKNNRGRLPENGEADSPKTTSLDDPDYYIGSSNSIDKIYTLFSKIGMVEFEVEKLRKYILKFHHTQKKIFPSIKTDKKSTIHSMETIEQLLRIDKYSITQIYEALNFALEDDFWSKQIRSLSALRCKSKSNGDIKFTNLYASYQDRNRKSNGKCKPYQSKVKDKYKNVREYVVKT